MKLKGITIPLLLLIYFFSSCEKKDKPIQLPPKGDGQVLSLDMGEDYEFQYFISLQEQKIVHISRIDNWDLAFQTGDNDHAIFLNGGKGMAAYVTGKTDFAAVNATDTIESSRRWKVDQSVGIIDSAAIGEWKNLNYVYMIRLDKEGKQVRKLKVKYEDAFQYIIQVGDINTEIPVEITVIKKKEQNYTYFSFSLLNTVENVEPANRNTWDLQATLYSYTFYDQNPPLPYVVNGFLTNPGLTFAYCDSTTGYANVTKDMAKGLNFSNFLDIIGYNWKKYDIDKNLYSVDNRYTYIIKTKNNAFFKLRFLDFYSATGVKGSPKFEFQPL